MLPNQKTFVAKAGQVDRRWWVYDAEGKPLGRAASRVADVLRGKHKAIFTPHVDAGDFVVVINADKVKLTGDKLNKKFYYRHSGIPGGFRAVPYGELMVKKPEFAFKKAVQGMLPKNVLGRQLIGKLKVYGTAKHPHAAQNPLPLSDARTRP